MLRKVLRLLTKGIGMALAIFAVGGMVWDIMNAGNYVMVEWNYTRMVIGSILVGIGFSVPCLIYDHPTLPYPVKVMVHMGIGGSVKNFVALVKNGSFLVRITDMTILIEKEFIYGSSKRPNPTDYYRKQHYQCG